MNVGLSAFTVLAFVVGHVLSQTVTTTTTTAATTTINNAVCTRVSFSCVNDADCCSERCRFSYSLQSRVCQRRLNNYYPSYYYPYYYYYYYPYYYGRYGYGYGRNVYRTKNGRSGTRTRG